MASVQPHPGRYWWFSRKSDILAMSFMFTGIQLNSFFLNHMIVKYDMYASAISDVIFRHY